MYPDCPDDTISCFEDYEHHSALDPTVKPVINPARRIPFELKDKLKGELGTMEKKGAIAKVDKPTDCVNSIIVKEKPNGRLRICLDLCDLNRSLKRDHYPTPTVKEMTPSFAGAKVFTKLDTKHGY